MMKPTAVLLLLFHLHLISSQPSSPIKTIVVIVMENRSFDHMLGWMKSLNPKINGVDGSEYQHINASDPSSQKFFMNNQSVYIDPDPGHSFQAIREQIFGSEDTSADPAPMNGFAQQPLSMTGSTNMSYEVMNGFNPDMISVYKALVSEFAVCDRWFASVPASTQPNRLYVHSGTSHGATSNIAELLAKGYPQRTIFDNIHDEGLSWGIYYQNIPATLFYKNLRKLKYALKFQSYGTQFKNHAKKGKLPNYTVIEQRYFDSKLEPANDDHPSHDVYQGQMFIKEVYEVIRASPQWNQTLMVITYDEHGGYFDHVPTPVRGVPSPDGIVGPEPFNFTFNRLGVRVPTMLISPWIEKGSVLHGPNGKPTPTSEYEHSSIPATVKKILNLKSPFLTKRDEWAGTFETVLTRASPRTDCPEKLPTPPPIRMTEAKEEAKITEFQQEMIQLASGITGDHLLPNFNNKIKDMTVREAKAYSDGAMRTYMAAATKANTMGLDGEQVLELRPSFTAGLSKEPFLSP
uniref:Non-specific phospholipase C2 n=1 Tax=Kalanchoe fedtschenkoi TaxID=63787 RepID=A0A7N0VE06_KALFE